MIPVLRSEYAHRCAIPSDMQAQMPVLYAYARYALRVIELGVRTGNSTVAFLAGLGGHGNLWSVDVNEPDVPPWMRNLRNWHFLRAASTSARAQEWAPSTVDVLFIDTDHSYETTLAELESYGPRVVPGGVILLHDTHHADYPGVAAAAGDWCGARRLMWTPHPTWPGTGIIEIPALPRP